MMAKLWSINALSIEFDLDRRTVARRIRGIPPGGDMAGKPAWHLADVAAALTGNGATGAKAGSPPPPPGFEKLAGLPALDQIATFALLEMAYRAPAQAGVLAVAAGASCETAFALRQALMVAMAGLAVELARLCHLRPLADNADAPLFDLTAFADCDWHALAQGTGEAVDIGAWERRATERFAA